MSFHFSREWFWDIFERRVDYQWRLVPKLHTLPGAYHFNWGPFMLIVLRKVTP